MTKKHLSISLVAALLVVSGVQVNVSAESATAEDEIRAVVEASYIHGAFNEQNTKAMRAGFHPTFKIHGVSDGELSEYPIDQWIASIEERKAQAGYQPQTWTHRFPIIDITGDAAVVKVELFHDSRHVYTDYLSLLRFADGWKITDKVYHRHADS